MIIVCHSEIKYEKYILPFEYVNKTELNTNFCPSQNFYLFLIYQNYDIRRIQILTTIFIKLNDFTYFINKIIILFNIVE